MADEKLPVISVDGIQIILSEHGAKLLIQEGEVPVVNGDGTIGVRLRVAALLNLSHEHLKLFTIYAFRQLRDYEKANEPIPLNKKVVETQKIDLKKEW